MSFDLLDNESSLPESMKLIINRSHGKLNNTFPLRLANKKKKAAQNHTPPSDADGLGDLSEDTAAVLRLALPDTSHTTRTVITQSFLKNVPEHFSRTLQKLSMDVAPNMRKNPSSNGNTMKSLKRHFHPASARQFNAREFSRKLPIHLPGDLMESVL